MREIDYSVIIRTTGKSNEKYVSLMDSIANLQPQPKEIIIVLPEGYDEPTYQLGWETFYYTKKGMVSQRLYGIEVCKTRYALITDDDIRFGEDFVEKLYEPIEAGLCRISAGPLYSFLPEKGFNSLVSSIMGAAVPTIFHKEFYCKILRTTGYSYNRYLKQEQKYYESQSLAWTCFFGEIEALHAINMREEKWLDKHGYASMDDTTMFYKAYLMGIKTYVVVDAIYEHLDAKTSTINNSDIVMYSTGFNRYIFWYRFIYLVQKNAIMQIWSKLCFAYNKQMNLLFYRLSVKRGNLKPSDLECYKKGDKDARTYRSSKEYLDMSGKF